VSEVLDLPAVTKVRLGELLTDIRNGLVVEQEKESPGIPITRIETISKGTVDLERVRYVRDTAGKNLDNFWLRKGDILFSHINSDLHLGKTAIVTSDAPLLHGMNLLRLRVDSNRLRPKYLHHWLDYCRRTGVFMAIAQHAVNQSSLNQKKITSLEVPLRSVGEQDEIVAELEKQFSRLDEAVANLQRVKANLKRYKASVLKAAIEGRLLETEATLAHREGRTYETGEQLLQRILEERRAKWSGRGKYKLPITPNISELSQIPEGWTWASVDSIATKVTDGVHKKPNYLPVGIPFVTVKNLTAGAGISFENLNHISNEDHIEYCKRTNPEKGDILISKDGTLGVVRLIQTDKVFSIFVSVALVKPVMHVTSQYLAIAFESPVLQRQMVPKGSGLQHIHLEDLRADCVPLPSLSEQARIVAEVDRHLSIIREVEAEVDANLQRAQALRQATLATAFHIEKT
jgi:type I restriction enzyme, S subunit